MAPEVDTPKEDPTPAPTPGFWQILAAKLKPNILLLAGMGTGIGVYVSYILAGWLIEGLQGIKRVAVIDGQEAIVFTSHPPELLIAIAGLLGTVVAANVTGLFALAAQVASDPPPPPWYAGIFGTLVNKIKG